MSTENFFLILTKEQLDTIKIKDNINISDKLSLDKKDYYNKDGRYSDNPLTEIMRAKNFIYDYINSITNNYFYNIPDNILTTEDLLSLKDTVLLSINIGNDSKNHLIFKLDELCDINSYEELMNKMNYYDPLKVYKIYNCSVVNVFANILTNPLDGNSRELERHQNITTQIDLNLFKDIKGSLKFQNLNINDLLHCKQSIFIILFYKFNDNINEIKELTKLFLSKYDNYTLISRNLFLLIFSSTVLSIKDKINLMGIFNNIDSVMSNHIHFNKILYDQPNYVLLLINKKKNYSLLDIEFFKKFKNKLDIEKIDKNKFKKSSTLEEYYSYFNINFNKKVIRMSELIKNSNNNNLSEILNSLAIFSNMYTENEFKELNLSPLVEVIIDKIISKYKYSIALSDLTYVIGKENTANIEYLCDLIIKFLPIYLKNINFKIKLILSYESNNKPNLFYFLNKSLKNSNNDKIIKSMLKFKI